MGRYYIRFDTKKMARHKPIQRLELVQNIQFESHGCISHLQFTIGWHQNQNQNQTRIRNLS